MKTVELNDFTLDCRPNGDLYVDTQSPAKASPFTYEFDTGNL